MSDPRRLPDEHPRRAEPLQPDKPGSGRQVESKDPGAPQLDSLRKAREQERTADDNVRKGYD